jgi:hypothetical protein
MLLTPFFMLGFTWVICAASMDGLALVVGWFVTKVPAQYKCDSYKHNLNGLKITISVSSFYYFIDKK